MNPLDLLDAPFHVIHEYHRLAFLAAQAEKEKEEARQKKEQEDEEANKQNAKRDRQIAARGGPMSSSIPMRQSPGHQIPTQANNSVGQQILATAQMGELEDMVEEGF